MSRALLVFAILTAACGSNDPVAPDAAHDAASHDAAGSGSDAFAAIDAHPHDTGLELLVAGLSMVVILGPVRGAQRRRRREML